MRRFIIVVFLLLAMVAVGFLEATAKNKRMISTYQERLVDYGRLESGSKDRVPVSLGAYSVDGGSPGVIIGRSWKDDQNHLNTGRMIDWRVTPQVHFIYNAQACGGMYNPDVCPRWIHSNMFDPTVSPNGVFVNGLIGIPIQNNPFIEGGMYPNLAIDENGRMIAVAEALDAGSGSSAVHWVKLWWDISPGDFVEDEIPDQNQMAGLAEHRYPIVEYQRYNGQYVTHVVALNGIDPADPEKMLVAYWRKEHIASGPGGVWTTIQIADRVLSDSYDMAVSRDESGYAIIAWCEERDGSVDLGSHIWLRESLDAGATWYEKTNIVPFWEGEPSWQPWKECSVLIDRYNQFHVVFNATWYNGTVAGGVDHSRILHSGGSWIKVVQDLDFNGFENMCGRFGQNLMNNGKIILSECNDRLYTIWMQAGDPERGDSTDCVDKNIGPEFFGAYNADIYMSVSTDIGGNYWDARRNLTQSKTPDCNGIDKPCDHDSWPTMSRFGMNTNPSVIGQTYWSSVPEVFAVRDLLDPTYPNTGFYLDVQYVNDLLPENARYLGDAYWTVNPIKWFRLPCVPPVLKPLPYFPSKKFIHPRDWVKSGTNGSLGIEIENIGNTELNITNVTVSYLQGNNLIWVLRPQLSISPGLTEVVPFELNQWYGNPPPGSPMPLEAWLLFEYDDVGLDVDSFYINTVIADTVVPVTSGLVTTGMGMQLGVLNNGSAANYPYTGGYLGFYNPSTGLDADCDSQQVYLYDVSPIIMYDANTYFWNSYYDIAGHEQGVNLLPVPSSIKSKLCSSGGMSQYITGSFVTPDSAIGMNKVWVAPNDDVSYVMEKWQIFSWDGAIHPDAWIGEWSDCNVPSDISVNNAGAVVQADDYVYVTGQETDGALCVQNDSRFYIHGLLGYYYQSEYDSDPSVNHTGLAAAYVTQTEDLMTRNNELIPDSVWSHLTRHEYTANNTEWDDQQTLLSIGGCTILPNDTLVIWIMHGSLINSDQAGVADQVANAKVWYMEHRGDVGICGCCGLYTGGFPGNTNCDTAGKRNLADITKLIDHVYISKADLCCQENGNVDGDVLGKRNLADITKLIDHVYISKAQTAACK